MGFCYEFQAELARGTIEKNITKKVKNKKR
jgi:hypothetical protein